MKKKIINIIGNNNNGNAISDGGRIKIRLYQTLLEEKGFDVRIIDLHNWKLRLFRILKCIKKAIQNDENIVIMAGPNGSRLIIPYVYKKNKHHHSSVVFCPVGIGTLDSIVKKLPNEKLNDFLSSRDFGNKKDVKFSKYLSSYKRVVVENKVLENCYKKFYEINNTFILTNFRVFDDELQNKHFTDNNLHCVYISRVCPEKGIFDLVTAVNEINKESESKVLLDIFGDIQLKDKELFLRSTNNFVKYCGVIDQRQSFILLSKYELSVLPTKYHGEGTSGSLVESLIAGTPVLVSNYSQSKELITDGYNGYVFEMNDQIDLKKKLKGILNNKSDLTSMRSNVKESSKKFIFKYVENNFYRLIGDVEEWNS